MTILHVWKASMAFLLCIIFIFFLMMWIRFLLEILIKYEFIDLLIFNESFIRMYGEDFFKC